MSRALRTLAVLSVLGSGVAAQDNRSWAATDPSSWFATFGAGFLAAGDTEGPVDNPVLSFDPGYSVSLGLGKYFLESRGLRAGLHGEILFNSFALSDDEVASLSLSSDKTENLTFMISLVGDFYLAPQFAIYLGGGVGYTSRLSIDGLDAPGTYTLEDDSVFSGQFRTGFKYALGGGYDMNLGYRYFRMAPAEISTQSSGSFDLDFDQHIIEVVMHWGL